jgi:hypothetical protein
MSEGSGVHGGRCRAMRGPSRAPGPYRCRRAQVAHCVEGFDWRVGAQSQSCASGMVDAARDLRILYAMMMYDIRRQLPDSTLSTPTSLGRGRDSADPLPTSYLNNVGQPFRCYHQPQSLHQPELPFRDREELLAHAKHGLDRIHMPTFDTWTELTVTSQIVLH